MENIFSRPALYAGFSRCPEHDFFITGIGYNNFKYIEPRTTGRIQHINTLHLVLAGSGTLNLGKKTYHVKSHDIFFIPPDVTLSYYPDSGNKWQYIWFEFVGANSEIYAEHMGLSAENPIKACNDYNTAFYGLYSIFKKLEHNGCVGYYEVLSSFYRLLDTNAASEIKRPESFSEAVISYLLCHYQTPGLTAENICRDFRISHSYLCRLFRRETGKSLMQHIIDIRISEACRLLCSTNLSVKEIAYSVGFNDDVHFIKSFKKHIGTSPTTYRKAHTEA